MAETWAGPGDPGAGREEVHPPGWTPLGHEQQALTHASLHP